MRVETTTSHVEIDGLAVPVRVAGLDRRQAGQAVIVLESGGSISLETWDPVLPELTTLAPVLAYDRAGTGESVGIAYHPRRNES
jgi:pimeloyl-ACP methyl ester carboxylesterase